MISFVNDYSENAFPEVIEAILRTNLEGNPAYTNDPHTENAASLIRGKIRNEQALIQLLMGGTQTNLIAAAAFLRPHEAVITVRSGHICVHETGAIESTGHKCLEVEGAEGKIRPEDVERVCGPQNWDHAGVLTVKPRMVYISQSTERGTVYSRQELQALRQVCDRYGLLLYCDGARLSSALDCSDVTLPDLAALCDAFYIGGTKSGALFGEAMVIINDSLKPDFQYIAKQRGGLLAKGWLLGLQFEVLMQDGLFESCGRIANREAMRLKAGLDRLGIPFSVNSPSNQQFYIFPGWLLEKLNRDYAWEVISRPDPAHTEIRLVTSWATKPEDVDRFIRDTERYLADGQPL